MKFLRGKVVVFFLSCLFTAALAQERSQGTPEIPVREIQVAAQSFSRGDEIPSWVEPVAVPPTSRTDPVVLRLWDTQLRAGKSPIYYVNRAEQINDAAALAWSGQISLDFVPQYQKLHLHSLRILRGKEVLDQTERVQVRFLQRELGMEQGIYSGVVNAVMLVADLRVGDTLQYSYSVEGVNPVFGGIYAEDAGWDSPWPVELRRVVFRHPVDEHIDWQLTGDAGIRPEVSEEGSWRSLTFSQHAYKGMEADMWIPADFLAYRRLRFSGYASWNGVARWANGLFPPAQVPAQMQPLMNSWRALPDAGKRAMAALQWVQEEIRYFSVSMGESSHRPRPPGDVVRDRFGDCKDKTYLLVTLLHAMGLDATPVLTSLQQPKVASRLLPSPLVFDHILVRLRLDGNDYYLDPTLIGQTGGLNTLGTMTEGAEVLVVGDDTRQLDSMHWPDLLARNAMQLEETFELSAFDADGALTATWSWIGRDAEVMRSELRRMTEDRLRKFVLGNYERRYPGIELASLPVLSDDASANRYTMTARFTVPKPVKEFPDGWVVRFVPGNLMGLYNLPKNLKRPFPAMVTRAPYRLRYKMHIRWPENVSVIRDPGSKRLRNAFFDFSSTRTFRGNASDVDVAIDTLVDAVAPDRLVDLAQVLDQLNTMLPQGDFVERGALKSNGFMGLGKETLKDNMAKRLREEIAAYDRTVSSGRLKGSDLVEALCRRAETWADLGEPGKGMADAEEAVKQGPAQSRAWECRGNLLRDNGEFARSIADYTRALALGASDGIVFQARGVSRFYLGNYLEAQSDFAQSFAAGRGDADVALYPALWHVLALLRTAQPPGPELSALAQGVDASAAWPKPLLAFMAGKLGEDAILEAAGRKQGDDKDMALTETWFFVGQHRLAKGDSKGAAEAFGQARKLGVTMYLEYMASGWELSRLKAGGQ
jgi:lipoprotein NlpI/transglutaminase-like putative cysteine protease